MILVGFPSNCLCVCLQAVELDTHQDTRDAHQ